MSSAVADLEAGLQAMLQLKPPGVSGSRIQSITTLCNQHVEAESVLIQKLFTHFKKAPGTHKLGVLYVVDSVTRKWSEQAKAAGQPINSAAQDGTYAAGVNRVKELLPVLMNDIIQNSPEDQKEKIRKLIDIWEKGQTFPLRDLNSFKDKLNDVELQSKQNRSTTPDGSPPPDLRQTLGLQPPSASAAPVVAPLNTSSILEALANMARQNGQNANSTPPANPAVQPRDNSYNVSNAQNNPAQQVVAMNSYPPNPTPVNVPAQAATFAQQPQGGNNGVQNFPSNQNNSFAGALPLVPPLQPAVLDPAAQNQLMIIQALASQGLSPEQIAGILAAMGSQGPPPPPPPMFGGLGGIPPPPLPFVAPNTNASQNTQNGWGSNSPASRDHGRSEPPLRSPRGTRGLRDRSRSRSPVRGGWNPHDSPGRRETKDPYGRDIDTRGHGGRDMVRPAGYRDRSPPRRQSPTPPRSSGGGGGRKYVGYDSTISKGSIKVMSRTLFVGGVQSSEQELRKVFEKYGKVQTCIVNKDKRHAFVKMISREDAVRAKDEMEKNRTPDSQLRTRWGVGFGPRDCSDYQTGVSIIPISKLTDADKKWMLTAEYGGSGGKPIESGMVVEEPDIEIGQGVSSKAISRRMQTDKGGNQGPRSTREREEEEASYRFRRQGRDDRRDHDRDDRKDRFSNISAPPSMPSVPQFGMNGFPFSFPIGPNGMPVIPPGFSFPGQKAQPPPPGRS